MGPKSKVRVAVAPAAGYELQRALFDMLSSELAVTFEPHMPGEYSGLQGLIALPGGEAAANGASGHNISCFHVSVSDPVSVPPQTVITFTSSDSIHRAFRGKPLAEPSLVSFSRVEDSLECLARVNDVPVWAIKRDSGHEHHYIGIDLPAFSSGEFFHAYFQAARWLSMVPLLHFLRHLLGPDGWPLPEPRATFIIDDPNLHGRRYGYIDFEKLIKHASTHNYHATIATVPLDTWYFNSRVAATFQSGKQRISMMMHGVNHVADELARPYAEQDAMGLLAMGLRRITAFEAHSGVPVARIMAAPHGAFAESIADSMSRLGYEAACVSVGSLLRWNPSKRWPSNLGLSLAQPLGSLAFPVFHRNGLSETDIRLSAFLGHPVVIASHHQDCVSNFARFELLANVINEIADTRWMGIEDISRTNYVTREENGTLHIWPYTRRFVVPLSRNVTALQVHRSPYCEEFMLDLRNKDSHISADARDNENNGGFRYAILNNLLQICFPLDNPVDYQQVDRKSIGVWPVVRRLLTETRDRIRPLLSLAGEATPEYQD